jgi:hypothetical protein
MAIELRLLSAATEREIDAAFATLAELRIGALIVASDPFFNGARCLSSAGRRSLRGAKNAAACC